MIQGACVVKALKYVSVRIEVPENERIATPSAKLLFL